MDVRKAAKEEKRGPRDKKGQFLGMDEALTLLSSTKIIAGWRPMMVRQYWCWDTDKCIDNINRLNIRRLSAVHQLKNNNNKVFGK